MDLPIPKRVKSCEVLWLEAGWVCCPAQDTTSYGRYLTESGYLTERRNVICKRQTGEHFDGNRRGLLYGLRTNMKDLTVYPVSNGAS
jgi:hypothetical protein